MIRKFQLSNDHNTKTWDADELATKLTDGELAKCWESSDAEFKQLQIPTIAQGQRPKQVVSAMVRAANSGVDVRKVLPTSEANGLRVVEHCYFSVFLKWTLAE